MNAREGADKTRVRSNIAGADRLAVLDNPAAESLSGFCNDTVQPARFGLQLLRRQAGSVEHQQFQALRPGIDQAHRSMPPGQFFGQNFNDLPADLFWLQQAADVQAGFVEHFQFGNALADILLGLPAFGDIVHIDDNRLDGGFPQQIGGGGFDPAPRAILMQVTESGLGGPIRRLDQFIEYPHNGRLVLRVDKLEAAAAEARADIMAGHSAISRAFI